MFSISKTNSSGGTNNEQQVISIIGHTARFKGNFVSDSDVHIEGKVKGSVRARSVIVGDAADVSGDIICETLEVRGKVSGNINAGTVILTRHCHVEGEILYKTMDVAGGAFLKGTCKKIDTDEAAEKDEAEESGPGNTLTSAKKASGLNIQVLPSVGS